MQSAERKLIDAIMEFMSNTEGSWRDRKSALLREASQDEQTQIVEFGCWFERSE